VTVIGDEFALRGYSYDEAQSIAAELLREYDDANNYYPPDDFTGAYSDTNANALWVVGNKIKKGGNKGSGGTDIRLKGVSLASLIYEDAVALVTNIIADTVNYPTLNKIRLPMYDDDWASKSDAQKLTHWNTVVQPCIDLCVAANIYAVVDYHGIKDWNSSDRVALIKAWADFVVPRVRNNPFVIIEMFNEPVAPVIYPWAINEENRLNWLAWRNQYQPVVDYIRHRYPCKNIITIGSPRYSTACVWADDYPFAGDNLQYTLHTYPNFTGGLRDYLEMPVNAASTQTILENISPNNVPVDMGELGYSTPDYAPGNETNLSHDTNFPTGAANFLVANKNVHPSIWAHSIYGLGTENSYGSTMKIWWKATLPTITT
jgi:hypothetical protein